MSMNEEEIKKHYESIVKIATNEHGKDMNIYGKIGAIEAYIYLINMEMNQ